MTDGIPKIAQGCASRDIARHMVATSTDPAFVERQLGPVNRPAPEDGRNRRATTTKAELLAACRFLMQGGLFRPSMASICRAAKRSPRSGFEHFKSVELLHLAAIEDTWTRTLMFERLMQTERGQDLNWIVRKVVTGRAP